MRGTTPWNTASLPSLAMRTRMLFVPLALTVVVAGCGSDDDSDATTAATQVTEAAGAAGAAVSAATASGDSDATYAIVLPSSKDDQSFSQAGYEGLMEATEASGAEAIFQENVQVASAQEAFRNLASQSPDVLIGLGGQFADAGAAVAPEFPDVHFVIVNGSQTGPNLSRWSLAEGEVAYLGGIMAASASPAPTKLGHVYGIEITPLVAAGNGFIDGARSKVPTMEYIDTSTGDMDDVAKAKEATTAAFSGGASIVFTGMNNAIVGQEQAAEEAGGLLMSNVSNKCADPDASGVYFGSSATNTPGAVAGIVTGVEAGELQPGFVKSNLELAEGFTLELCGGTISSELQADIEAARQQLVTGAITVSTTKS